MSVQTRFKPLKPFYIPTCEDPFYDVASHLTQTVIEISWVQAAGRHSRVVGAFGDSGDDFVPAIWLPRAPQWYSPKVIRFYWLPCIGKSTDRIIHMSYADMTALTLNELTVHVEEAPAYLYGLVVETIARSADDRLYDTKDFFEPNPYGIKYDYQLIYSNLRPVGYAWTQKAHDTNKKYPRFDTFNSYNAAQLASIPENSLAHCNAEKVVELAESLASKVANLNDRRSLDKRGDDMEAMRELIVKARHILEGIE